MKKYITGFILFSLIILPMISFAQDVTNTTVNSSCIKIVNNLKYKDRDAKKDNEVSSLQRFLKLKQYLSVEPTGYFGVVTLKAVKDFQKANEINPTGYVGTLTRAKIQELTCILLVPEVVIENTPTVNPETTVSTITPETTTTNDIPPVIQKLTIVSPNGGENFRPGRQMTVTWTSVNMEAAEEVSVGLVKESNGLYYTLMSNTENDGSTTFTIPTNIREGKYRAHVKKLNTEIEDYSDNSFRIES
jgi:peptidoglycan hydrolase-like protein with peptidoglycan-binding domain